MTYLIYNPLANNRCGEALKDEAMVYLKDKFSSLKVVNGLDLKITEFVSSINKEDEIILVGGDGTLNYFANSVYNKNYENKLYLFRAGTGNDFVNDVATSSDEVLIPLNDYLKKLPKVYFNDKERYFLNCAGLGIDGLVCKNINDIKMKGTKKANYTFVSFKALMFQYRKNIARVIIDGIEHNLQKVWLITAMNGRYFGGGMPLAPYQDRKTGELSFCFFHCKSKLKTLFVFLNIFKAKHLKFKKNFSIIKGKTMEVIFKKPAVLQIDGETFENITSYKVEI